MVKLMRLKQKGRNRMGSFIVTIPPAMVSAKGWEEGMELAWVLDSLGNLILRPKA